MVGAGPRQELRAGAAAPGSQRRGTLPSPRVTQPWLVPGAAQQGHSVLPEPRVRSIPSWTEQWVCTSPRALQRKELLIQL